MSKGPPEVGTPGPEGRAVAGGTGKPDFARLGRALDHMLAQAHTVPPDQLPALGEAAQEVGVTETAIFLADYSLRRLVPFSNEAGREVFDIDATVGGRAFVLGEPIEVHHEDEVILWVPLVDGVDRLGVAQFRLDDLDDERRGILVQIAALLATEVVSRGQYSDVMATTRRTEPMALPAEMQWELLRPPSFSTGRVALAAAMEPSHAVAGDAYDYAHNRGVLHAALFDAVGHDLRASLICGLAVATYRHLRRREAGLAEIADAIDANVMDQFVDDAFVTALLMRLDSRTGSLEVLNAGHPPGLLLRQGHLVSRLSGAERPPLGFGMGRGVGISSSVQLEPGDRMVFFTDGIVEARSAGGGGFGIERLIDFVERHLASGLDDYEMTRRLMHAVVDHHDGRLQDDATVLVVHWRPSEDAAASSSARPAVRRTVG